MDNQRRSAAALAVADSDADLDPRDGFPTSTQDLRTNKVSYSPLFQVLVRQYLDREWMSRLSANQFKLLTLIFDRTFSWQRSWEFISVREFVRGRTNFTSGTGLSARSVYRGLQELETMGAILIARGPGERSAYRINIHWRGPVDDPFSEAAVGRFASALSKL